MNTSPIERNRRQILQHIAYAEQQNQRPKGSVNLIAVSKTFPHHDIRTLYQHGQRHFGENYIQEWQQKCSDLHDCPDIVWHIIGNIQSNKTRIVAEHAHWVHTIDRIKTAQRLNDQRPEHLPPLQVCIEINIAAETAKHGIAPHRLDELAHAVSQLPKLRLRGLMCVAQATDDAHTLHQQFAQMQQLLARLQQTVPQADTLSMGMSSDLDTAIAHGATHVRIGSAIFGKRDYPDTHA